METLVASAPRTELRPWGFMVAWDGVLTLAYRGFPQPLVDLKQRIADNFPALPPENPGSKWPKTTLGALADASPPLTLDQLHTLKRVCDECNQELLHEFGEGVSGLRVDQLAVVVYCCTSLEKRLITHRIDLLQHSSVVTEIEQDEAQKVDSILSEFHLDQLEGYINKMGCTLVFELPHPLPAALVHFKECVDEALGVGFYEWFDPSALHVTVRGL